MTAPEMAGTDPARMKADDSAKIVVATGELIVLWQTAVLSSCGSKNAYASRSTHFIAKGPDCCDREPSLSEQPH